MIGIKSMFRFQHLGLDLQSFDPIITKLIWSKDSMGYWASSMDHRLKLALHVLEQLACPFANVLSRRVFSTAGGLLQRWICLSPYSVDQLTFIKMSESWVNYQTLLGMHLSKILTSMLPRIKMYLCHHYHLLTPLLPFFLISKGNTCIICQILWPIQALIHSHVAAQFFCS